MTARELSNSMIEGLKTAAPAVARVAARRRYALSGTVWGDGFVVTTNRAVEDDEIQVMLEGGDVHPATLVGRDPSTDLALLKVDAALSAPVWTDEVPELGTLVVMVGRPHESLRATLGIVSEVGGPWRTAFGGRVPYRLRTDASSFQGFSGGPLLTVAGEIVGVNTAALSRSPTTLPTVAVRRVVETLRTHGRMRRGYLGLGGQSVRLSPELREASGQSVGLLVVSVEPGTPAADAGLLVGDTLLRFGDERIQHPASLVALLGEETVGQTLSVTLARGGVMGERSVQVAERP